MRIQENWTRSTRTKYSWSGRPKPKNITTAHYQNKCFDDLCQSWASWRTLSNFSSLRSSQRQSWWRIPPATRRSNKEQMKLTLERKKSQKITSVRKMLKTWRIPSVALRQRASYSISWSRQPCRWCHKFSPQFVNEAEFFWSGTK